ncbi:MAG: cation transporter [Pontiellaceae bacterium]|nr:cation transporter [Pontiellaceae bacterium]
MNSNTSEAKQITVIGLIINVLLSALKFALGILGHSQAVVADAVHSLSDMGTDLLVLFGIRIWSAPADERHPYGHQRIETIITLLISVLLGLVAFEIALQATKRLGAGNGHTPVLFAVLGPLVSIIVKEILFRKTRAVGKQTHSPALIANAWHHRSDALSSIPALIIVAIASINPEWAFLDAIGAVIVAILILKVTWEIASPALSELSERGATDDDVQEISRLAESVEGVYSTHRLRTRRIGAGWFVDLHVTVDGNLSVREGHDIADAVQNLLLEKGPSVADVTVHIEPEE